MTIATEALPLEVELAKVQGQLAEALTRLDALPGEIHAAKVASRRNSPAREAFDARAVRSLVEEQARLEAAVPQFEGEVLAIQEAVADERKALDLELLKAPISEAEKLTEREIEKWGEGASLLAKFVDWYDGLADIAEARAALHREHEPALARVEDEELRLRGKAAFRPPVAPWPADFLAAVDALVDASMDPRGMGRRKPGGVQASPVLVAATPDLTARWRRAELHREERVYGVERSWA